MPDTSITPDGNLEVVNENTVETEKYLHDGYFKLLKPLVRDESPDIDIILNATLDTSNPVNVSVDLSLVQSIDDQGHYIGGPDIFFSSDTHEESYPNDVTPSGLVDDWLI